MQWVPSASLLFAWFPFRAKAVGIVKNTWLVTSHPPVLAGCAKHESQNPHTRRVLSQRAHLGSCFSKIQVLPCDPTFATQHVLTLGAWCFADTTGEAWQRGARGWEERKPRLQSITAALTQDLSTQWPWKLQGHMAQTGKGILLLVILLWLVLWSMLVQGKSSLQNCV